MEVNIGSGSIVRRYLLRDLPEQEHREFEDNYFLDQDLFDQLREAEDALVDEYVHGTLSPQERRQFDTEYLTSTEREHRLAFARELARAADEAGIQAVSGSTTKPPGKWRDSLVRLFGPKATIPAGPGDPEAETRRATAGVSAGRFRLPQWATVAAGVLVTLSTVWVLQYTMNRPDPQRIIADAYASWRTIDFRLAGAPHAQPASIKLAEESSVKRPFTVLHAQAVIAAQLAKYPADPRWLQAQARAQLLAGEYVAAGDLLKRILAEAPNGSTLRIECSLDLAAAYFEEGRKQSSGELLALAYETLSDVLRANPNDPAALFNRAITAEALQMQLEAIKDWEKFLALEPNSKWADEARQRLARVRQKAQNPVQPDSDPRIFLRVLDSGKSISAEIYVDTATLHWLPIMDVSNEAYRALSRLADLLLKDHDDPWLADLLRHPTNAPFKRGAMLLSESAQATMSGDRPKGADLAREAAAAFKSAGNLPAELRARMEVVYAISRSLSVKECLREATAIEEELMRRGYAWVAVQTLLEQVSAHARGLNYARATAIARAADELSAKHHYKGLQLRATAFAAAVDRYHGKLSAVWEKQLKGLNQFWTGHFIPMRGYQFLADLSFAAEREYFQHTAFAFAREASILLEATSARMTKAMAQYRIGTTLAALNERVAARTALDRAEVLFKELPVSPSLRQTRLEVDLQMAELELREHRADKALNILTSIKTEADRTEFALWKIRFSRLLGFSYEALGNYAVALDCLIASIRDAEHVFSSFQSPADRLYWQNEAGSAYRKMVELKLQKGFYEDAFVTWQTYRAAALQGPRPSGQLPPISFLTARGEPVAVLSYVQSDSRLGMWLLDHVGLVFRWVDEPLSEIRYAVDDFARLCSDPGSDIALLSALSKRLYRMLVGPWEERLAHARMLVIEVDSATAPISFSALLNDKGHYLSESHVLAYSSGLWSWYSLHARVPSANTKPLRFLMAFNPSSRAASLRHVNTEETRNLINDLKRVFPQNTILDARQSTATEVLRLLPQAEVFHFLGHGLTNGGHGALVLSAPSPEVDNSEEIIDAPRISGLDLRQIRLVVLAACSTAIGEMSSLANPDSLVRSFMIAGVPSTIAGRWRVDLGATTQLTNQLYKGLVSGMSAAAALHDAERAVRQDYPHPYYWASFSLYGADHAIM